MPDSLDALDDNDARFAEFARTLTQAQWTQPSLCTGWTNQDVLAHLVVGYTASLGSVVANTLRRRGSFDQANADMARGLAGRCDPGPLIDELTALAHKPRGVGRVLPRRLLLGDHVIHELDITYALGEEATIPATTLNAVLCTEVHLPNPFVPAAARARGLNLYASDTAWAHRGNGPPVIGKAAHLASVLAGRPWALPYLSGDGVVQLRARM